MSDWTDYNQAAAALANPALPAGELAAIAAAQPGLSWQVAAHPAVYPDLLRWLEAQGRLTQPALPAQPAPQTPPRRHRRRKVVLITVVAALAAGGGAAALANILGGGDAALPARPAVSGADSGLNPFAEAPAGDASGTDIISLVPGADPAVYGADEVPYTGAASLNSVAEAHVGFILSGDGSEVRAFHIQMAGGVLSDDFGITSMIQSTTESFPVTDGEAELTMADGVILSVRISDGQATGVLKYTGLIRPRDSDIEQLADLGSGKAVLTAER
ncbi:MAG: hypothetical protein LBG11_07445 [Bifidobacteriaceae bacterium]|jgi:hypothetical protein|nr:hypothetical protein [Bifidobacteriaceae bacterium]